MNNNKDDKPKKHFYHLHLDFQHVVLNIVGNITPPYKWGYLFFLVEKMFLSVAMVYRPLGVWTPRVLVWMDLADGKLAY